MIISIFASIGAQNLGDELILKNEIEILRERYKTSPQPSFLGGEGAATSDLKFIVFSYDLKNPFYVADDVEYKEYFPIGIRNFRNIFRNIVNFFVFLKVVLISDLIVVGGGGIIYDKEKQATKSPLDSWLFRSKVFRLFRKKFSFFGVGISVDAENKQSLEKVQKIFSGAYKIELRDNYSYNLLQKLGIKSEIILDPVFYDNGKARINRNLCLKKLESKEFKIEDFHYLDFSSKTVALAFRKGYFSKSNNPKIEIHIIKELIEYLQKSGAKVVLIPHSFHKTDLLANDYKWMQLILKETSGVDITNSMQESYEMYKNKKIDICFAQRLHSIILSNVYNIHFVAFSYSRKTKELLKEFTLYKK